MPTRGCPAREQHCQEPQGGGEQQSGHQPQPAWHQQCHRQQICSDLVSPNRRWEFRHAMALEDKEIATCSFVWGVWEDTAELFTAAHCVRTREKRQIQKPERFKLGCKSEMKKTQNVSLWGEQSSGTSYLKRLSSHHHWRFLNPTAQSSELPTPVLQVTLFWAGGGPKVYFHLRGMLILWWYFAKAPHISTKSHSQNKMLFI